MTALGYAYMQLNRMEEQRTELEAEQHKLTEETQEYRGELEATRNQVAAARASLASARAAINAFHAGNLKEALSLYDEALSSDPDNAYLQNLRAYTLFRLGRTQAAVQGEERSVALDPNYAWGYFDLARFLCASSPTDMNEAKEAAQRALELRPDLRTVMRNDGEFQRVCRHEIP